MPIEFRHIPVNLQLKPTFPKSLFKSQSKQPQIRLFKSLSQGLPVKKRKVEESLYKRMMRNKFKKSQQELEESQEFINILEPLISQDKYTELINKENRLYLI